jgi:hypothetical protein
MALGISSRSLRRILHIDLKLHPYKMMLAQELSERDPANRTAISEEILEQVPAAAVLLSSDEAHFHISGAVNKQNFRQWAERNLRDF